MLKSQWFIMYLERQRELFRKSEDVKLVESIEGILILLESGCKEIEERIKTENRKAIVFAREYAAIFREKYEGLKLKSENYLMATEEEIYSLWKIF